jgi:hypothetical protein
MRNVTVAAAEVRPKLWARMDRMTGDDDLDRDTSSRGTTSCSRTVAFRLAEWVLSKNDILSIIY